MKNEVGGKLNTSTAPGTNGTPLPVAVTAAALVTAIAAVAPTPKKAVTDPTLTTRYWLVGGVTAVKVGKICSAVGALELAVTTTVGPFGKNAVCSLAIFVFQGYSAACACVDKAVLACILRVKLPINENLDANRR